METIKPIIMDGSAVAEKTLAQCGERVAKIKAASGVTPCLATVLVGVDPSSVVYVKMKVKRCEKVGMKSLKIEMSEQTTTEELIAKITELSNDPAIHGILLQHPVPKQIDERAAFEAIAPEKDVDGVTVASYGSMTFDDVDNGFESCTPGGMMRLLKAYDIDPAGKHAVVVGRSPILGKPMAMLLLGANATVTICHSRTPDVGYHVKQADIVVAAVGIPEFIKGEWVKAGAVVLDAGYNAGNVGDVDYQGASERASFITPVPGGVGPMTIATLIDQTSISAAKQLGVDV